ncbi:MAG TPA: hypothetical protein PKL15_05935 [Saprospiraceae bacterium]|nr:hypothetical protein [Saprospiraceae bacterium]
MSAQFELYEEMAEILAQMDPEKVLRLKASPARSRRLEALLEKNREKGLNEDEIAELDRMLMLNRMIGLAKMRAKQVLNEAKENTPITQESGR